MSSTEAAAPTTDAATRIVAYEQPLNERMRNFLRLDFLYQQAVHHHTLPDPWSTRAAVSSLLEILAITQRGDIRSEVLKELERQMNQLSGFASRPGVDSSRLKRAAHQAAPHARGTEFGGRVVHAASCATPSS